MSDGLDPKPSPSGPFDKRLSKGPEGEGMGLAAAPGGNHLHSACKSRPEAAAKISVGAGFYPARGPGRAPPLQIITEFSHWANGKSPAFRLQIQVALRRLVRERAAQAMMPAGGNP